MNKYQPRNYTAHGGKETVIGGRLTFLPGAEVVGLPAAVMMPKASALPDSDAKSVAQLREDYNALLGVLRAAGLLASEAVVE
ncbi:MAG: Head fiber protein [Clostridia bacterium]|nr:Head fiber protein [Clostridia bacterium]MBR7179044.1 Head fiber protein [Oscillospiraceae bacterium]